GPLPDAGGLELAGGLDAADGGWGRLVPASAAANAAIGGRPARRLLAATANRSSRSARAAACACRSRCWCSPRAANPVYPAISNPATGPARPVAAAASATTTAAISRGPGRVIAGCRRSLRHQDGGEGEVWSDRR